MALHNYLYVSVTYSSQLQHFYEGMMIEQTISFGQQPKSCFIFSHFNKIYTHSKKSQIKRGITVHI